jgi:hypothetical protein
MIFIFYIIGKKNYNFQKNLKVGDKGYFCFIDLQVPCTVVEIQNDDLIVVSFDKRFNIKSSNEVNEVVEKLSLFRSDIYAL